VLEKGTSFRTLKTEGFEIQENARITIKEDRHKKKGRRDSKKKKRVDHFGKKTIRESILKKGDFSFGGGRGSVFVWGSLVREGARKSPGWGVRKGLITVRGKGPSKNDAFAAQKGIRSEKGKLYSGKPSR